MKKGKIKATCGFTLLEVLIAITLTGLVIVILSNALIQSNRTQYLLTKRLTAVIIGQSKMTELIVGSESGSSGNFSKPYQNFRWNESQETLKDGSNKITLTVEWRDNLAFPHQAIIIGYRYPE